MERYVHHAVPRFLNLLAVAVHLTAGQPVRSPELLSVRDENVDGALRNIFIDNDMVSIVTAYH